MLTQDAEETNLSTNHWRKCEKKSVSLPDITTNVVDNDQSLMYLPCLKFACFKLVRIRCESACRKSFHVRIMRVKRWSIIMVDWFSLSLANEHLSCPRQDLLTFRFWKPKVIWLNNQSKENAAPKPHCKRIFHVAVMGIKELQCQVVIDSTYSIVFTGKKLIYNHVLCFDYVRHN